MTWLKAKSTVLVFLFIVSLASAETATWRNVSSFDFAPSPTCSLHVTLDIPSKWEDSGDFTRIQIKSTGHADFSLTNKTGWVEYMPADAYYAPELKTLKNLVTSKHVLVLGLSKGSYFLFLVGYAYASSPGSLDVLEISSGCSIRRILHKDEMGLKDVVDLDGDGINEIVGYPCLSQTMGQDVLTYDPFHVYEVPRTPQTKAEISTALSKAYNLKHYYGWAGLQCREDIAVVLHPKHGNRPIIVSAKKADAIAIHK